MKLIVDTREQCPLDFSRYDCEVERGTLATGDYSVAWLEHMAAIERKSINDLVACCMGEQRDRFERELSRGRELECFCVVVEASMQDVAEHNYRSNMHPHAVLQSLLTFQVRYRVPFVWAGSPRGAAYVTFWTLAKFVRELEAVEVPA